MQESLPAKLRSFTSHIQLRIANMSELSPDITSHAMAGGPPFQKKSSGPSKEMTLRISEISTPLPIKLTTGSRTNILTVVEANFYELWCSFF